MTAPDDQYEALRQTGQLSQAPLTDVHRSHGAGALQQHLGVAWGLIALSLAMVLPTLAVLVGLGLWLLRGIIVGSLKAYRRSLVQNYLSISDFAVLLWRVPRDIAAALFGCGRGGGIVSRRTVRLLPSGFLASLAIAAIAISTGGESLNARAVVHDSFQYLPRVALAVPLALALLSVRRRLTAGSVQLSEAATPVSPVAKAGLELKPQKSPRTWSATVTKEAYIAPSKTRPVVHHRDK